MAQLSLRASKLVILLSGLLVTTLFIEAAGAATTTVRYNCKNGPQLTVVYKRSSLRYVYDGPRSAMRTMRAYKGNLRHFKDGRNSITLEPNRRTVDYREGSDLYDRCKSF